MTGQDGLDAAASVMRGISLGVLKTVTRRSSAALRRQKHSDAPRANIGLA
jgi:hypothetical protein